jgi:hypothetical protein
MNHASCAIAPEDAEVVQVGDAILWGSEIRFGVVTCVFRSNAGW